MKNIISISEVRKRLPRIIKEVQKHPEITYQITVYNEVMAEIKAPSMVTEPGLAAKKLLELRKRLHFPSKDRTPEPISENIKRHLYHIEDGS